MSKGTSSSMWNRITNADGIFKQILENEALYNTITIETGNLTKEKIKEARIRIQVYIPGQPVQWFGGRRCLPIAM